MRKPKRWQGRTSKQVLIKMNPTSPAHPVTVGRIIWFLTQGLKELIDVSELWEVIIFLHTKCTLIILSFNISIALNVWALSLSSLDIYRSSRRYEVI